MSKQPKKLVLASRSPRRHQLLKAAGYTFDVRPPGHSAESPRLAGETPEEYVARLAYQKAADVAQAVDAALVIGCDTVAECDGQILGKPNNANHARLMLETLSGRKHRVLSGLCIWNTSTEIHEVQVAITTLRMDCLTTCQLDQYLQSGAWQGKAGAFGFQDRLGWVHILEGSESNVVGLPMELLDEMITNLE